MSDAIYGKKCDEYVNLRFFGVQKSTCSFCESTDTFFIDDMPICARCLKHAIQKIMQPTKAAKRMEKDMKNRAKGISKVAKKAPAGKGKKK